MYTLRQAFLDAYKKATQSGRTVGIYLDTDHPYHPHSSYFAGFPNEQTAKPVLRLLKVDGRVQVANVVSRCPHCKADYVGSGIEADNGNLRCPHCAGVVGQVMTF